MDLPRDLCLEIFSYLPVRRLLTIRITSKDALEYAKHFKGGQMRIQSIKKWNACFPRATKANISGLQLSMVDMLYLTYVEDLEMSMCCPYGPLWSMGISWFRLPRLKKLTITDNNHFTDECLSHFTELEDLSISHSNQHITGSGFRFMTKLKRLTLNTMRHIEDQALMGLPIEDLTIISNSRITDEGIRQLTRLTKLYLCWVRRVRGHGYENLPLKQIFISEVDVDRNVFQSFARVPIITFSQCHFMHSAYELLTKLEYLTIYESSFEDIDTLSTLLELGQFVQVHLVRCPEPSPSIQEKMGTRLKLTRRWTPC